MLFPSVNAFPEKDGLQEFREWIESPDPSILGKLDVKGGNSKKKMTKTGEGDIGCSSSNLDETSSDQSVRESQEESARRRQFFMDSHVITIFSCIRLLVLFTIYDIFYP